LNNINKELEEIERQMKQVEDRINAILERVFADFNRKIGFDIRTYEKQRSRELQQINEERARLQLEISRLENVLEVVRGRNEKTEIERLNASIKEDESKLKRLTDKEKKLSDELDKLREQSRVIQDRVKKVKRELEDKETEMEEAKKILKKEVYDLLKEKEKALTNRENMIESLRNKRADLVNRCRIENIELPTLEGDEGHKKKRRKTDDTGEYLTQSESFSVVSQSEESEVREEEILLDFSSLEKSVLNLKGKEYEAQEKDFEERIDELTAQIDKLAPSTKQSGRAAAVNQKFEEAYEQYKEAKNISKKANDKFDDVKKKRFETFMKAFEPIQNVIDSIYKDLTKSDKYPLGGTAHLGMEEPDEPYLGGIRYNAMPPTKRFRDMVQLSGGEKTVAALALLFAIHHYRPSPFFILDEIDAALDNANVAKIGNYVRGRAGIDAQFLVISLKENFFGRADSLVGVYRNNETKSSGVLTIDLKSYDDTPV
jgi:structural maintenance of chromosome 1